MFDFRHGVVACHGAVGGFDQVDGGFTVRIGHCDGWPSGAASLGARDEEHPAVIVVGQIGTVEPVGRRLVDRQVGIRHRVRFVLDRQGPCRRSLRQGKRRRILAVGRRVSRESIGRRTSGLSHRVRAVGRIVPAGVGHHVDRCVPLDICSSRDSCATARVRGRGSCELPVQQRQVGRAGADRVVASVDHSLVDRDRAHHDPVPLLVDEGVGATGDRGRVLDAACRRDDVVTSLLNLSDGVLALGAGREAVVDTTCLVEHRDVDLAVQVGQERPVGGRRTKARVVRCDVELPVGKKRRIRVGDVIAVLVLQLLDDLKVTVDGRHIEAVHESELRRPVSGWVLSRQRQAARRSRLGVWPGAPTGLRDFVVVTLRPTGDGVHDLDHYLTVRARLGGKRRTTRARASRRC